MQDELQGGFMNRRLLSAALICFLSPLAAASSSAPSTETSVSAWVHPGADAIKEGGYEGAQTCTMCHDAALKEVTHSVHWYVSSEVRNVQGMPDGSWWGMVCEML